MRASVPPRRVAAQIKYDAAGRAGWGIAATALITSAIIVSALLVGTGAPDLLALPVFTLGATGAALGFLVLRPAWPTAVAYLLAGAISVMAYVLVLAASDVPAYASIPHYLLIALGLVGTANGREGSTALWCFAGMAIGNGSLVASQLMLGQPVRLSTPALLFGVTVIGLLFMQAHTNRVTQKLLPDLSAVDEAMHRHDEARKDLNRAAAFVHETILSDLALVAHGPASLSSDEREGLRLNLASVSEADPTRGPGKTSLPRTDFYALVRDFQWRGLGLDVGGSSFLLDLLGASAREALMGSLREVLDNVLKHSGCDSAEIFIDQTVERITVMVVDEGCGFEIDAVPDDRIGLKVAVMRRVEDAGGTVTVWSMAGAGTTVVLSFPYEEDKDDYYDDDDEGEGEHNAR